jgi:hypothetical protein
MAQGTVQARLLPDGRRLHLSHGPIDLIIEAFGSPDEISAAYQQAGNAFPEILPRLVEELEFLRRAIVPPREIPTGPVAQRMERACWPHRRHFVTPMAAVAGAVADEILDVLTKGRVLEKAYVNNGGDIAFALSPGATLTAGLVSDYHLPAIDGTCVLDFQNPARGIATSGWKGRSHSLGIADSVTVLAPTAAAADAAATLIANTVNYDDPAVERVPAHELDPDSDLGDRLVTVNVGKLDNATVAAALSRGHKTAAAMARAGHITAAVLVLRQEFRIAGIPPASLVAKAALIQEERE